MAVQSLVITERIHKNHLPVFSSLQFCGKSRISAATEQVQADRLPTS